LLKSVSSKYGSKIILAVAVLSLIGAWFYGRVDVGSGIIDNLDALAPSASSFTHLEGSDIKDGLIYQAEDGSGNLIGYITATEGAGYGGPMTVMVAWSLDNTILGMIVPQHNEDDLWWRDVDDAFFTQYLDRRYNEPLLIGQDINAVSGSTVSSVGVASGVSAARTLYSRFIGDPYPSPSKPIKFGDAEIALIVGLGMVFLFRTLPFFRGRRWTRYITLAYGFFVLGFWLVIPLSLSNLAAWLVHYTPPLETFIIMYILVFGIVGLAVVFGKNYYCYWLCPFSSFQELINPIPEGRFKPKVKIGRWLRRFKFLLLWLALMVIFIYRNPGIASFEPWNTLFTFKGELVNFVLLGMVMISATLFYNFWCFYLCPVGASLELILKTRKAVVSLCKRIQKACIKNW